MKNRKLKNLKTYELTPAETAQCDAIHAILNGIAESTNQPVKDIIALASTKKLLDKWNVKICRTCNEILPESLFANRQNKTGDTIKRNTCKKCVQNYYQHQYKPNKASSDADDVKLIISGGEITPAKVISETGKGIIEILKSVHGIDIKPTLNALLEPRKSDDDKMLFISTPKGSNTFYDEFLKQKTKPDELFTPQNEIMFELESAIATALLLNEKLSALEMKIEKLFESGVK